MPQLLGILNVTPDSFSDGGLYARIDRAVDAGLRLLDEGADWVDVGGESTRPGSRSVSADEELSRVLPAIRGILARRPSAQLSIDTSKAAVAEAAIEAGARMVNDVSALRDPAMAAVCAASGVELILMHMRGQPLDMQSDTVYDDLVGEVCAQLLARVEVALEAGVEPGSIRVDPGLGFGKAPLDNPQLVAGVPRLAALGYPVVIGASRKRFIGELTGVAEARERTAGSIGAALAAAEVGAAMLRVHDVAATRHALTVYSACRGRT